MRISDWSSDVCSSDLTFFIDQRLSLSVPGISSAAKAQTSMQKVPHSQGMDYVQASAELNRMSAQYGTHGQEPTPMHFPDAFSTPGASRERAPHIDIHGNYGSTPSMQQIGRAHV